MSGIKAGFGPRQLWLRLVFCLGMWLVTASASPAPGEKNYTVQRGDTLSGIAHTYGVALSRLAQRNNLSRSYHVKIGQRLIIPAKTDKKAAARGASGLPASVQKAIDNARVKPGRWKHIVVHHSGVNTGTLAGMDRYHREVRHMENGLAYHFVIGNSHGLGDGEVGVGSRWTKQLDGGHLISQKQNEISLGICLVGNFDKDQPTAKQMERLTALIQALMTRCQLPRSAVTTHQRINVVHTRCPGRYFSLQELLSSLDG